MLCIYITEMQSSQRGSGRINASIAHPLQSISSRDVLPYVPRDASSPTSEMVALAPIDRFAIFRDPVLIVIHFCLDKEIPEDV